MRACLLMLPLVAAGAVTGVAAAAVQHEPAAAAAKPHLLYALVDDLGWYNVQLHNPKIRTPHFVELRSQGILLDRHYTFKYCSPSRNSLMSGRLPIHVKEDNGWVGGVPQNMTVVAAKLKEAGYATHQIGKVCALQRLLPDRCLPAAACPHVLPARLHVCCCLPAACPLMAWASESLPVQWHAGAATLNHVPAGRPWSDGGRGFDTSLGYLHCCEDHFKQTILHATDYWANATPAFGMNATLNAAGVLNYCTHNYVAEATRVLSLHDPSTPMFMFMAFHNNHGPLQVTPWYKRYYPEDPEDPDAMVGSRATYNGMTTAWDDGLKNITALFKAKGMWSRTVLVVSGIASFISRT
jgi:arylsulfatase B